jgi:ATP-dependent Clp protease adapter protein ClpS
MPPSYCEKKMKEPEKYCVVIDTKDIPIDIFVTLVYDIFNKTLPECFELKEKLEENSAICIGPYIKEIAETKMMQCLLQAAEQQYEINVKLVEEHNAILDGGK